MVKIAIENSLHVFDYSEDEKNGVLIPDGTAEIEGVEQAIYRFMYFVDAEGMGRVLETSQHRYVKVNGVFKDIDVEERN